MCGVCEGVCPNNVSIPEICIELLKKRKEGFISKEVLKKFFLDPLKIFLELNNWLKVIPIEEKGELDPEIKRLLCKRGEAVIYYSCDLKYFYPEALERFLHSLKKEDVKVSMPLEVECCGAPFLNMGYISLLKEKALKNLKILEKTEGNLIMFCATCLWIFKKVYPQVFRGSIYEERFRRLAERVISGYKFLSYFEKKLEKLRNQGKKVIFHLPCHLTEDFNLVKNRLEVKNFCCGSPKVSLWLEGFQKKFKRSWIKNLENVDFLATFCAGCYLNFNLLLKRPPQIKHWFEFL